MIYKTVFTDSLFKLLMWNAMLNSKLANGYDNYNDGIIRFHISDSLKI